MQLTLKVVFNLRPDKVNFFNFILSNPHDILAKGVEDDESQMDVGKDDLEEVQVVVVFA